MARKRPKTRSVLRTLRIRAHLVDGSFIARRMLDLVDHVGDTAASLASRLQERQHEQAGDDPPLVVLDPFEKRADLVFEHPASGPQHDELQNDADRHERYEQPWGHSSIAGHDAHEVAAWHEDDEEPAGAIDTGLEPPIDRGQFSYTGLGPRDGAMSVPPAEIEEDDCRSEDSREADDRIGDGIDEGHRSEEVPVSR